MSELNGSYRKRKRNRKRRNANLIQVSRNVDIFPPHLPQVCYPPPAIPKVYVNPNYNRSNSAVSAKPSIHLNPKIISNFAPHEIISNIRQDIRHMIHVNPRFRENFNAPAELLEKVPERREPELIILDSDEELDTPEVIIVERRTKTKIIRGSRAADKTLEGISPEKKIKLERCAQMRRKKRRKISKTLKPKKQFLYSSRGLVSIGGVMYRTSRNYLIRSKARTNDQGNMNESDNSTRRLSISISPVKSYKTNISHKFKQRSLQILRNKMQKNDQPCLLYQKFGFCAKQQSGTCPKVHDKKLVQVCRSFLQGKCLLDDCPLSHNVGPEKMPTCRYFLEGCCTRERCPYLHVKVSSNNPICIEFLRGYCHLGNECKQRHIFACPDFDKEGRCAKGKFCPYPHKSSEKIPRSRKKSVIVCSENLESRKRYYDELGEEHLGKKRESLLKKVQIIKDIHLKSGKPSRTDEENVFKNTITLSDSDDDADDAGVAKRPKRPPIGPLPAYIPFD